MLVVKSTDHATVRVAASPTSYVFPVDTPRSYVDTFGAPRMNGTPYAHAHQGIDVFAPEGTPVRAVSDGIVFNVGVATLGGNKLWLRTRDGTCYYYAHLAQFGPNTLDPKSKNSGSNQTHRVSAGQVLGSVGRSGNALDSPPNLHFEIHPKCGGAINPTPVLKALEVGDISTVKRLVVGGR